MTNITTEIEKLERNLFVIDYIGKMAPGSVLSIRDFNHFLHSKNLKGLTAAETFFNEVMPEIKIKRTRKNSFLIREPGNYAIPYRRTLDKIEGYKKRLENLLDPRRGVLLEMLQEFPDGFTIKDLNKKVKAAGFRRIIASGAAFTNLPEDIGVWEGQEEGLSVFGCLHPERIKNYL